MTHEPLAPWNEQVMRQRVEKLEAEVEQAKHQLALLIEMGLEAARLSETNFAGVLSLIKEGASGWLPAAALYRCGFLGRLRWLFAGRGKRREL